MAKKPIPSTVHGALDYISVLTLLTVPQALGWTHQARHLWGASALGTLGYSLVTRYEWGVFKMLPLRQHMWLDGVSGVVLCVSSLLIERDKPSTRVSFLAFGLFEICVALLSQTTPTDEAFELATVEPV